MTTAAPARYAKPSEIARLLSVILSGRIVINTAFRMGYAFVPELSQGLGIDLLTMGKIISVRAFAGMLAPVFGTLSDRFGRRGVMFGALTLLIACATLSFVSSSLIPFAFGFIGLGIAKVAFEPSASAYLGDRVPYERRGLVMGMSELGWAGGGLLGVPIAAHAIALWGWQSPFALIAIAGAVALLYAGFVLPRKEIALQTQRVPARTAFAAVARHRSALLMLAVAASLFVASDMIAIAYATWLTQTFHIDVITLGNIVATFAVADVCGELLSMFAVDRFGNRYRHVSALLTTAAFFGGLVAQLDYIANTTVWVGHHVPSQVRNLTGPHAGLGRQQHDHAVAQGVSKATGVHQEIINVR